MQNAKIDCLLVDYYVNGTLQKKLVTEEQYENALTNETLTALLGQFDEGSVGYVTCTSTQAEFERLSKLDAMTLSI